MGTERHGVLVLVPTDTRITQQELPACKPVLEPLWVGRGKEAALLYQRDGSEPPHE